MTKQEATVIEMYTGVCMLAGDDRKYFYEYAEKLLGHPIMTHEYLEYAKRLKELSKPDFLKICESAKNDGWIPVERKTPPTGKRLQAKIKHHEWIADYDNDWVPEEERTRHPEYTEICEIVCVDGIWRYMCKEDGYELSEAYINPQKDVSVPIDEIIAWRPLSESYRPEAAVAQRPEWKDRMLHTFLGGHHD